MALQATPYKVSLDISDVDRGVYETVKMTVARHPSETELRLTARILAFAMFYHEHLALGRGLSDVDEAALWQVSLDGQIEHWIDVGQPDADRMIKSSRRAPLTSVVVYGNPRVWAEKVLPKVSHIDSLRIKALPLVEHEMLSKHLSRNLHWGVMITDGVLYISDGENQVEMTVKELK
ncbi:YaeQ family protein [Aliidiomarina sp. Khilg15.8]